VDMRGVPQSQGEFRCRIDWATKQELRSGLRCELLPCARAREIEWSVPRELRHLLATRVQAVRRQRGQYYGGRGELLHGRYESLDRRVRTEIGDPPAMLAQREPEHDQPQRASLTRGPRPP